MTKIEFALLINEILNEFDGKLISLKFNEEEICEVSFEFDISEGCFYIPYRFMNRAKLRFIIMDIIDLLEPVDPEIDLGF